MRPHLLAAVTSLLLLQPLVPEAADAVPPVDAPPTTAPAERRVPYVFAKVGKVLPLASDLERYGGGLSLEAGVGVPLAPHVALEASVGQLRMTHEVWAPVAGYDFDEELSAVPLLASVRLSGRTGAAELFADAGAGVYWTSFDSPYASDRDTTVGFHLGAGIVSHFTPHLTVGADARYVTAKTTLLGSSIRLGSLVVSGLVGFAF
jgi:opacity protein-like surface antigen